MVVVATGHPLWEPRVYTAVIDSPTAQFRIGAKSSSKQRTKYDRRIITQGRRLGKDTGKKTCIICALWKETKEVELMATSSPKLKAFSRPPPRQEYEGGKGIFFGQVRAKTTRRHGNSEAKPRDLGANSSARPLRRRAPTGAMALDFLAALPTRLVSSDSKVVAGNCFTT